jgi:TPR repeat protein
MDINESNNPKDAEAQYKLDDSYVEKDPSQAFYWWQKAADQGSASAQYQLGISYAYGEGVKRDDAQVLYWLQKAADQGNVCAARTVAELKEKGSLIEKKSSGGGCYIATAVYGSYNYPQVWTLRRYRDNSLAKTGCGRALIRAYYAISPSLVKRFGNREWFQRIWKRPLDAFVARLQAGGVENTPYMDRSR